MTARTLYAQVRNSVGQIWNTASAAFQTYATANIADYDVAMAEQGTASQFYVGTFPAGITTAGVYGVVVKDRAGASPAEADVTIASGSIEWDGSAVVAVSSRATPAQVNTEVLDVLTVDTFAEIGQEAPAATNTLGKMIRYLFKAWRNRKTQTSTTFSLYDDAGTTVDQKATTSDDGTTTTIGEVGSGP